MRIYNIVFLTNLRQCVIFPIVNYVQLRRPVHYAYTKIHLEVRRSFVYFNMRLPLVLDTIRHKKIIHTVYIIMYDGHGRNMDKM